VPEAFGKLVVNDSLNFEAGKLPTLIGQEGTFTFQNLNIERGLLWNQENLINRGVQVNYSVGPVVLALSWNDGFYSNSFTYLTGSATWTVNDANTLVFAGGVNTTTDNSTFCGPSGPLAFGANFCNEQQYDVSWTYTNGPWLVNPWAQYTHVPANSRLFSGNTTSGDTWGGAILGSYTFDSSGPLAGFSLPARFEYISSSGNTSTGPNLLGYGAGSNAWDITVTPTYQYKRFFARVEGSYINVGSGTAGSEFGSAGKNTDQFRALVEGGFVF
jgi:hypothetical protein